jgi:hypothetical protein
MIIGVLSAKGQCELSMKDIYKFEAGDVFEYQTYYPSSGWSLFIDEKRTITSGKITADTIIYTYNYERRRTDIDPMDGSPQFTFSNGVGSYLFIDSTNHFLNRCDEILLDGLTYPWLEIRIVENSPDEKSIEKDGDGAAGDRQYATYTRGLGRTNYSASDPGDGLIEKLVGYVKNSDTVIIDSNSSYYLTQRDSVGQNRLECDLCIRDIYDLGIGNKYEYLIEHITDTSITSFENISKTITKRRFNSDTIWITYNYKSELRFDNGIDSIIRETGEQTLTLIDTLHHPLNQPDSTLQILTDGTTIETTVITTSVDEKSMDQTCDQWNSESDFERNFGRIWSQYRDSITITTETLIAYTINNETVKLQPDDVVFLNTATLQNPLEVNCFPNPSKGYIVLKHPSHRVLKTVTISNPEGRIVLQHKNPEDNLIQLPERNGLYYIRVSLDNQIYTFPIVKN